MYYSKRLLSVGRFLLYGVEYCDKALIDSHNTDEQQAAVEFQLRLHCCRAMSGCLNAPNCGKSKVPRDHARLVWQRHFKPPSKYWHSILDRVGLVNDSIRTAWDAPANGILPSPYSCHAPQHLSQTHVLHSSPARYIDLIHLFPISVSHYQIFSSTTINSFRFENNSLIAFHFQNYVFPHYRE